MQEKITNMPVPVKNILRTLDLELTPNAKIITGSMKAIMAGGKRDENKRSKQNV
jgi:hypothetical protein